MLSMALLLFSGQIIAQTFTGGGNPQPLPPTGTSGGPTVSAANVGLTGTVGTDFTIDNVTIDLTHTFDGDLDISLISPSGASWDLSLGNGGGGDNYTNTVFMDGAPSITTGAAPFTGTFQAEEGALNTGFAGEAVNGNWSVSIIDNFAGDSGTLLDFSITFSPLNNNPNPNACTIPDNVDPTISCPGDIFINLDPGACDQIVGYTVSATDNCPLVGPLVSLSTNNDFSAGNITNSIACPGGGYQTLLVYDLPAMGVTTDVAISSLDFGIFQILGNVNLTANVYSIAAAPAGGFNYADLTLLASGSQAFGGSGTAIGNIPLPATIIPAGTVIAIELIAPNGSFTNGFIPGYNAAGLSSGVSLLASNFCNLPNPTPIGDVIGGFTDVVMMQLNVNTPLEPTQTAGLPSGSTFPIGTTTNTFEITDGGGNTVTCSFDVVVAEFVPTSNDITCNSLINISLDENCQAVIGADQILEGNNYGCYDNFAVTFASGPQAGQPLVLGPGNIGETIQVMVTNPSGNPCWGSILVEDKLIPDLVCSDLTLGCADDATPGAANTATLDYAFATLASNDNNTVTETVAVTEGDLVEDLDVTISTTHTWIGDVTISITSPDGTTVQLFDRPGVPATGFGCNNTTDLDFSFDDEAAQTNADLEATCPPTGAYQPVDALSGFDGENAQGTWTVSVSDAVGGDGGDFDVTLNLTASNNVTVDFPIPAGAVATLSGPNTYTCLLYTSPSPRDATLSRMPSSA